MTDKFQNKYRIPTPRLQNWNYGSEAMYFVTICTAHRECYFGNIVNGEMVLSELGKIVEPEWLKTFEMRQDMNLQSQALTISECKSETEVLNTETPYFPSISMNALFDSPTICAACPDESLACS